MGKTGRPPKSTESSKPKGIVADLFAGAGSTLMASEQLGRSCRSMELEPGYCDVIMTRWEALTGGKEVLAVGTSDEVHA